MKNKVFDLPISIQKINEETEQWEDVYRLHASVNKSSTSNEYLNAGAVQAQRTLTFEVRYFKNLEEVGSSTQTYRILFNGAPYNITDYDDYQMKHNTVKLLGVSYG